MAKLYTWIVVLLGAGLTIGVAFYIILLYDPLGWGIVHSQNFGWQKFASIKTGDRIDFVIETLGEPVRPPEDYTVLTEDPRDPCTAGGCKKYVFAGALWGATFKEAIVITDPRGYVIKSFTRPE